MPSRPLLCLTLGASLLACGPVADTSDAHGAGGDDAQPEAVGEPAGGSSTTAAGGDPGAPVTTEPRWRAPEGPAPWDDGWPREWFYAHPRPADDWRWARMAQHVGHVAPEFDGLTDWRHGEPVRLADLRGRPVLLKFWATWCGDCKASVDDTEASAERLGGAVTIVEICARQGGEAYAETLGAWGIEQLAALDGDGATEAAYDVPRWPFYVLIDSAGIVRATGLRTAHVDEGLDLLLARDREG